MSFYSIENGPRVPGEISGNLGEIRERVALEAFRVFDAGLLQTEITENCKLNKNARDPLKYVSGKIASNNGLVINTSIERIDGKPKYARVKCDVIVSIEIDYTDINNANQTGFTTITVPVDCVLFVPRCGLVETEVKAKTSGRVVHGEYTGNDSFDITALLNIIIEVGCDSIIMLPSYGYANVPKLVQYKDNISDEYFAGELFCKP